MYIERTVGDEEGEAIDQLFFNDSDGFMFEICNFETVKLVRQRSIGRIKLPFDLHNPPLELDMDGIKTSNVAVAWRSWFHQQKRYCGLLLNLFGVSESNVTLF